MQPGKLIVLYGINNLGKSTQAKIAVARLQKNSIKASYLKYPLYDLAPSGPLLNEYLRGGNPQGFVAREFQFLQVLNRTQYDSELRRRIAAGEWIVAEDYVGTGIAWGMGSGVDGELLMKLNEHLLKEDLAIVFEGERFLQGKEPTHRHETDDALMTKVRATHEFLATKYQWARVAANQSIEEVSSVLWDIISKKFNI